MLGEERGGGGLTIHLLHLTSSITIFIRMLIYRMLIYHQIEAETHSHIRLSINKSILIHKIPLHRVCCALAYV